MKNGTTFSLSHSIARLVGSYNGMILKGLVVVVWDDTILESWILLVLLYCILFKVYKIKTISIDIYSLNYLNKLLPHLFVMCGNSLNYWNWQFHVICYIMQFHTTSSYMKWKHNSRLSWFFILDLSIFRNLLLF